MDQHRLRQIIFDGLIMLLILGALILAYVWLSGIINSMQVFASSRDTYKRDLTPVIGRYDEVLSRLDALSATGNIDDVQGQDSVQSELGKLKAIDHDVEQYQPSPLFAAWHDGGMIMYVAAPYDRFADSFMEGIRTKDRTAIARVQDYRKYIDRKLWYYAAALDMMK